VESYVNFQTHPT